MAKKLIAITGGIGSGKSLALSILKSEGYYTLSSDQITAELYEKRKIKLLLKKMFPVAVKGFFNPKIDRSKISEIVFNNKEKLEQLTATITPLVVAEIQKRAKKVKENLFVEVPILFERGYQNQFDKVIIITRAMEDRINSVKIRSNLSKEQVLDRIKNQFDYENADLSPYFSIQNDGSAEVLKQKLLDAIKNI